MGNSCTSDDNIREERTETTKGFNPFFQQNVDNKETASQLSRYKFHSRYKDKYLGECNVIQQRLTGDLYLTKQLKFNDLKDYQQRLEQMNHLKSCLLNQHVLQIKEIISTNSDGLFTQYKKIILIIDYPFINLQRQLGNRKIKNLLFTKEEITRTVSDMVEGYAWLQRSGLKIDKVRLRNVYISIKSKQPVIKVAQNDFMGQSSNYENIYYNGDQAIQNYDIYLAPQQLREYNESVKPLNSQYSSKSGVFSLGMSILEMCLLIPSRQIYNYDEGKIHRYELNERISIAGKNYGGFVQRLLKDMLNFDIEFRPTFSELQMKIPKLLRNTTENSQSIFVSVAPNRTSQFMKNQSDPKMLRSSIMRKSMSPGNSRVFSSRSKVKQDPEDMNLNSVSQQYANGSKYKGQKKNGLRHGKGRYTFKDGSYYEGSWKNNKMNGRGNLITPDGRIQYSGQWIDDQYSGWGTLNNYGGNWVKYQGQFKHGMMQGRGKMVFKDGSSYDGQFLANKIQGYGRKTHSNGTIQEMYWDGISPSIF